MRVYDEFSKHRRIQAILHSDAEAVPAVGSIAQIHSQLQQKSSVSHIHVPAEINGLQAATWPIGSIFIAVVSTNPASLLGFGTWVAFAPGRVMVGLDVGQAEFDTVEETGGAKTHTLATSEIPAHTHTYTAPNAPASNRLAGILSSVDGVTAATATGSTGGGDAHNNLQPYIVVYAWKRTA